ncbi:MAG: prepilin-type N-terminal cleavage/methylation domain-containing protein [Tatlockia sp.]|nr:prepilin-type N-terminal cleavage/methylation domain-containing protein [Tatlockia sp.]
MSIFLKSQQNSNHFKALRGKGFSLIELMFSLFAISLLVTLVMQQYLVSKRQYLKMQNLLEQNLELHLVTGMIRNAIHSAGFTPCQGLSALESMDRRNCKLKLAPLKILKGNLKGFKLSKMDESFTKLEQQLGPRELLIKSKIHYDTKQTILIADCYHAETQEIISTKTTSRGQVLTIKAPLAFNYLAPVYLGKWVEETFLIKKNKQNKFSLFYESQQAEELSSLVDDMFINIPGKGQIEVGLIMAKQKNILIKTKIRAG